MENQESVQLLSEMNDLNAFTSILMNKAKTEIELPYWIADDYLRAIALLLLDWAWLKIKQAAPVDPAQGLTGRWIEPARALRHWISPEFNLCMSMMKTHF